MEHSHGGLDLSADTSALALWLRLALLLTTALVAGVGLVRPELTVLQRRVKDFVVACAAAAGFLIVVSLVTVGINVYGTAAHVPLVAPRPLLVGEPRDVALATDRLVLLVIAGT